jgi:hypothetical protein
MQVPSLHLWGREEGHEGSAGQLMEDEAQLESQQVTGVAPEHKLLAVLHWIGEETQVRELLHR